jgi:RimJ/RimL family protein N-acetyltransferase
LFDKTDAQIFYLYNQKVVKNVKLRKTTLSDAKLLFDWVNEYSVRNNAINTNQITWIDHLAWLQKKLASKITFLFIAEINDIPIGQIRFDLIDNKYIIDYSIARNERGKGYGLLIVKEAINEMKQHKQHACTFLAWVKSENAASRRVFEKLGFNNRHSILQSQTELSVYELTI